MHNHKDFIIAHDVGTFGHKAVLTHLDGRIVGRFSSKYEVEYPKPGWAEQDPDVWWRAIIDNSQQLLQASAVRPAQIAGITFSTQMLGLIPVSQRGQPLCPAVLWMDTRAEEQARQMMRKTLGPRVFAWLAGVEASGKDVVPKLLWFRANKPDLFAKTFKFLDVNSHLLFRCTGEMLTDWTAASVTGLFDLKQKTWNRLLARFFQIPLEKLPEPRSPTSMAGKLTPDAARELGLLEGTPVICGAGDAPAAAVGSGAVRTGQAHIYLGTSGWVGVITDKAVTGKNGIAPIQAAQPDRCLLIAETEAAGVCLQWLADTLYANHPTQNESAYPTINREAESVPPGCNNLLFAPWLYGERSPVADVFLRAAFINLGPQHSRAHLARAVFEGVAFNLRWILDILRDSFDFYPDTLRTIGGGARNDPWVQIIADVTGKRIERVAPVWESVAIGAALIAAVGLGAYPDLASTHTAVRVENTFIPRGGSSEQYERLFAAYKQTYRALRPIYRQLNA